MKARRKKNKKRIGMREGNEGWRQRTQEGTIWSKDL